MTTAELSRRSMYRRCLCRILTKLSRKVRLHRGVFNNSIHHTGLGQLQGSPRPEGMKPERLVLVKLQQDLSPDPEESDLRRSCSLTFQVMSFDHLLTKSHFNPPLDVRSLLISKKVLDYHHSDHGRRAPVFAEPHDPCCRSAIANPSRNLLGHIACIRFDRFKRKLAP